jgi:hypothetical protein
VVGLANLVLQDAIERIFVGDIYGDIYAGIYVIRGENVVLLGEIVPFHYSSPGVVDSEPGLRQRR